MFRKSKWFQSEGKIWTAYPKRGFMEPYVLGHSPVDWAIFATGFWGRYISALLFHWLRYSATSTTASVDSSVPCIKLTHRTLLFFSRSNEKNPTSFLDPSLVFALCVGFAAFAVAVIAAATEEAEDADTIALTSASALAAGVNAGLLVALTAKTPPVITLGVSNAKQLVSRGNAVLSNERVVENTAVTRPGASA
jgi:hypothetical protein